jgi:hypothetical protein
MALGYFGFGVMGTASSGNPVSFSMEEAEILKAIEVIFSKESREDSLQYRYVDSQIITSLGKPPEFLICQEPHQFRFVSESVDLMHRLLEECRTESQKNLFFGVLRQTFDSSSPYHWWAPLAFATLIRGNRPEEALHQAMANFAVTLPFSRLLTLFSENLHYEHHRFSDRLLEEVSEWIKELFTNPVHSGGRELMAQRHSNRPASASLLRSFPKIQSQIDEIRFLRLKGRLLKGKKWEGSQDRRRTEKILDRLNPSLLSYLREFDDEYEKGEGHINLGRAMGHLREFMYGLCALLVERLGSRSGITFSGDVGDMDQVCGYLKGGDVAFFNHGEERLFGSVMEFLCTTDGIRYLPEAEFGRVGRDLAIETALILLEKLEAYPERGDPASGTMSSSAEGTSDPGGGKEGGHENQGYHDEGCGDVGPKRRAQPGRRHHETGENKTSSRRG